MGTNHIVEVVDNQYGNGSSKKSTDGQQVKPLPRHERSASSSSSDFSSSSASSSRNLKDDNLDLKNHEFIELSIPLNVPSTTSNEPTSYQPNRIPSSIFSAKPAIGTDWSNASNESLFSIHVGNNSFSKDQFLALNKSGELTKLDEQIIAKGGVMPSLKELEDMEARENENVGKQAKMIRTSDAEDDDDDGFKDGIGFENHAMKFPSEAHNSRTRSISGLSDESTLSFAFPVLSGTDGRRPSSVNRNEHGLKTPSVKQQQQQEPKTKQIKEEWKTKSEVNPQIRNKLSWFRCCRHP